MVLISKNKINEKFNTVLIANDEINNLLKQKYAIFNEIIKCIKDNNQDKEFDFQEFLKFNRKDCTKSDLIKVLDKTTIELNEYFDRNNDLLKNKKILDLKGKLYHVEINLEAVVEYYNNKLKLYNETKKHGPTSIASKLFDFSDFNETEINTQEISRLISLN